ncbi:MAG: hypothetical protein AB1430_01920 [Pseudomonadota bacterium]
MAQVQPLAGNPFALMMHPDDVLQAVERSDHLGGLQRRICRPLDRPLIPKKGEEGAEVEDFDSSVDTSADDEAA